MSEELVENGLNLLTQLDHLSTHPDEKQLSQLFQNILAFIQTSTSTGNAHLAKQLLHYIQDKNLVKLFSISQLEQMETMLSGPSKLSRQTSIFRIHFNEIAKKKTETISMVSHKIRSRMDDSSDDENTSSPVTPFSPSFGTLLDDSSSLFEVIVAKNRHFHAIAFVPEIVSYIFTFLDCKDQWILRRVCRLWREISKDELLWKYKYFDKWTIYSGAENWKSVARRITFCPPDKQPKEDKWEDLCKLCYKAETRHLNSESGTNVVTTFGAETFSYNR